jgi:hypothetical protein
MTQQLERTMVRTSLCLTYPTFQHSSVIIAALQFLLSHVSYIIGVLCGVILDLTGQGHLC